jgi:hypothetical protein
VEKHIVRWSYSLGLACAAIALIWRGLNTIGVGPRELTLGGASLFYSSFLKGCLLLLLIAIATANVAWYNSQSKS